MRLIYFPVLCCLFLLISCTTSQQALFSRKSPHEQYSDRINTASLASSVMGRAWLNAATKALQEPLGITLPYQESGYFAASETDAQGYRFSAKRGEQLVITINRNPSENVLLFMDLWEPADNALPKFLASVDTASATLNYEVKKDGNFLLRLQPELLASTDFKLVVTTAPSLGFPVATAFHPKIGSFWGASRDAGARQHEGIDIFGAFRTPVIAAADGIVTSVTMNRLGGKVVFMRPAGKNYSLYYAHLDSQLVQEGQRVKMGDTLGLMGNTGNAKNTPTHLHFGLYAIGGAIDPLPFVNDNRPQPAAIKAPVSRLQELVRCTQGTTLLNGTGREAVKVSILEKNSIVQVKAATGSLYKVALPDNKQGYIAATVVNENPVRSLTVTNELFLLDRPDSSASTISKFPKGTRVNILGNYKGFLYVSRGEDKGWIAEK